MVFFWLEHQQCRHHRVNPKLREEYIAVQGLVQRKSVRHYRESFMSNKVIGFPSGIAVFGCTGVWKMSSRRSGVHPLAVKLSRERSWRMRPACRC